MGRSVITGVGNNNIPQPIVNNMKNLNARSNYVGSTNFIIRDMHNTITITGNHTDWFK